MYPSALPFALGSIFIWLVPQACGILVSPTRELSDSYHYYPCFPSPPHLLPLSSPPPSLPFPLLLLPPFPSPSSSSPLLPDTLLKGTFTEHLLCVCYNLHSYLRLWIIPKVLTIFLGTQ